MNGFVCDLVLLNECKTLLYTCLSDDCNTKFIFWTCIETRFYNIMLSVLTLFQPAYSCRVFSRWYRAGNNASEEWGRGHARTFTSRHDPWCVCAVRRSTTVHDTLASSHFPGHHYSIHNCSFLLLDPMSTLFAVFDTPFYHGFLFAPINAAKEILGSLI